MLDALQCDYPLSSIRVLQCFLDPTNYAAENPEPPIPVDFDPEDDLEPENYHDNSDPVFKLFFDAGKKGIVVLRLVLLRNSIN